MKNKGFTLIELMIAVAILAIIMGIAIPAYNGQVEKSRRADAMTGLLQAAQQLERCYTRFNTYDPKDSVGNAMCAIPNKSPDEHYEIKPTLDDTTFTLKARPIGAQTGDDCAVYTLTHQGIKDNEGNTTDRCWGS